MNFSAIDNSAETISASVSAIHAEMLRRSPNIKSPNFDWIDDRDVQLLFELYDQRFFGGSLAAIVKDKTGQPMGFRVSSAMSRAGGKTLRYRQRGSRAERYEIAIASRLLSNTFGDVEREVIVCGHACQDRLQAMQRIMEHEIIHLIEIVTWGDSSCKAPRFKTLARRIFGHTGTTHDLVTTREIATKQHGVSVGDTVTFEFAQEQLRGVVNRISHRATVLVESDSGVRYSNGKKYQKFYIPLKMLKPCERA